MMTMAVANEVNSWILKSFGLTQWDLVSQDVEDIALELGVISENFLQLVIGQGKSGLFHLVFECKKHIDIVLGHRVAKTGAH
jgi:hypothetical protein